MLSKSTSRPPSTNWQQRIMYIVVLLTCTYTLALDIADVDLWGHVQYGRDVFVDGEIAPTTTYSYTAEGHRWVNHENLAEITFAFLYDQCGLYGLILFKFLLSLGLFGLVMKISRRKGADFVTTASVCMLLAACMSFFWSYRPQLLSFSCFALMLWLLDYCFRDWQDNWHLIHDRKFDWESGKPIQYSSLRMRLLWLGPVILFVWANSHGGFVAGLCIFCAYLVFRSIEAMVRMGNNANGIVKRFALMSFAAIGATMINPYGAELHWWLLSSLGEPRPEIEEWAPTDFSKLVGQTLIVAIAVTGFALAFSKKQRDFTHILILGITLWQGITHYRHIPFFVIPMALWVPIHFQSAVSRFRKLPETMKKSGEATASTSSASPVFAKVFLLFVFILGGMLGSRLLSIRVERKDFPVTAFAYMADNNINGRMVVTYDWAQYAIAAFCTEDTNNAGALAFDGRFRTCYPQVIVDMHFDFVMGYPGDQYRFRGEFSPPFDPTMALTHGEPEIVVIDRSQLHSTKTMQENADWWCLLYQDSIAQVWGVRTKYDDPTSPSFIAESDRRITDHPQTGWVAWPALPEWKRSNFRATQIASQ